MFSDLLQRKPRRSLLIEINPYQVLVAGVSRGDQGLTVVNCAAEFSKGDDAGLHQWLQANFGTQKSWTPVICGLVPSHGFLQRESVQPNKLTGLDYLSKLVREKYKIENPEEWRFRVLSPLEGAPLLSEGPVQPALLCGMPNAEVDRVQQRLSDLRLRPVRLEAGRLALFGVVFDHMARHDAKQAAVVVNIEEDQTVAYVLGKEGVHTPSPVRHGFRSILQTVRKELGLGEEVDVRALLRKPTDELRRLAPKFVRAIGRDLKPLIDSYEMTTGQPAGGIYCTYLPPDFAWLAEPLAQAVERPSIIIDCAEWLPTVGLKVEGNTPAFGPHWIGALALIAELPGSTTAKVPRLDDPNQGAWHLDCRLNSDEPSRRLVGRRFLTGAVAVAVAAFALTITGWQLYVSNSLRTDTAYWETEMAKNQKLFDELTKAATDLAERSARLDYAYNMMASPYQVSEFVLSLGRTLPRTMRIDRIELSQGRIALSGGLREPSESASGTLNRYLEELRRSPQIGPLFSSIGLTALQREPTSEALVFEISFKVKVPQPPAPPAPQP